MSGMRKRYNEMLMAISGLPVKVTKTEFTGSGHLKVFLDHHGEQRFFIYSASPSDKRALKNFKGTVLKWIRGEGETYAA